MKLNLLLYFENHVVIPISSWWKEDCAIYLWQKSIINPNTMGGKWETGLFLSTSQTIFKKLQYFKLLHFNLLIVTEYW